MGKVLDGFGLETGAITDPEVASLRAAVVANPDDEGLVKFYLRVIGYRRAAGVAYLWRMVGVDQVVAEAFDAAWEAGQDIVADCERSLWHAAGIQQAIREMEDLGLVERGAAVADHIGRGTLESGTQLLSVIRRGTGPARPPGVWAPEGAVGDAHIRGG